jgi:hypothetical protein
MNLGIEHIGDAVRADVGAENSLLTVVASAPRNPIMDISLWKGG